MSKVKSFRARPAKDGNGMIDPNIMEIYNIENPEERYAAGRNEFRIGEYVNEDQLIIHEEMDGKVKKLVAYAKNSWRRS